MDKRREPETRTGESIEADGVGPLQANLRRAEPEILASYALIGAVVALGGAGYLLDRALGTTPWLLFLGLIAGVSGGLYGIARTVWRR